MARATVTKLWGDVSAKNATNLHLSTGRRQTNLGREVNSAGMIRGPLITGCTELLPGSYIRCNELLPANKLQPVHAEPCAVCGKLIAHVCDKKLAKTVRAGMTWQAIGKAGIASRAWRETRIELAPFAKDAKANINVWVCASCCTDVDAMRAAFVAHKSPEVHELVSENGGLDWPLFIATLWNEHNDKKLHATYPDVSFQFGRVPCIVDAQFVNAPNARTLTAAARAAGTVTRRKLGAQLPEGE